MSRFVLGDLARLTHWHSAPGPDALSGFKLPPLTRSDDRSKVLIPDRLITVAFFFGVLRGPWSVQVISNTAYNGTTRIHEHFCV